MSLAWHFLNEFITQQRYNHEKDVQHIEFAIVTCGVDMNLLLNPYHHIHHSKFKSSVMQYKLQ